MEEGKFSRNDPLTCSRVSCFYVVRFEETGHETALELARKREANGIYTWNWGTSFNNTDHVRTWAAGGHLKYTPDGRHYIQIIEHLGKAPKPWKKRTSKSRTDPKPIVLRPSTVSIEKIPTSASLRGGGDMSSSSMISSVGSAGLSSMVEEWLMDQVPLDGVSVHKLYGGLVHPLLNRRLVDPLIKKSQKITEYQMTSASTKRLKRLTKFLMLSEKHEKQAVFDALLPRLNHDENTAYLCLSYVHCMHDRLVHVVRKQPRLLTSPAWETGYRTVLECVDCLSRWHWCDLTNRLPLSDGIELLRRTVFHCGCNASPFDASAILKSVMDQSEPEDVSDKHDDPDPDQFDSTNDLIRIPSFNSHFSKSFKELVSKKQVKLVPVIFKEKRKKVKKAALVPSTLDDGCSSFSKKTAVESGDAFFDDDEDPDDWFDSVSEAVSVDDTNEDEDAKDGETTEMKGRLEVDFQKERFFVFGDCFEERREQPGVVCVFHSFRKEEPLSEGELFTAESGTLDYSVYPLVSDSFFATNLNESTSEWRGYQIHEGKPFRFAIMDLYNNKDSFP